MATFNPVETMNFICFLQVGTILILAYIAYILEKINKGVRK